MTPTPETPTLHARLFAEYEAWWHKQNAKDTDMLTWLELRLAEAEKLPDRWRNIAVLLENEKRKVQWESEEYLSHCAVQSTLERCANGLDAALAHDKEKP